MNKLGETLAGLGIFVVGITLVGLLLFRAFCITSVENHEFAYSFNWWTGEIAPLSQKGWIVHRPIVYSVYTIDKRPFQVCINANQRVLNCKLVQFNPEGWKTLVDWHTVQNYDASSGSHNGRETYSNFADIMRSYAYEGSGKNYPFLTILRELRADDAK